MPRFSSCSSSSRRPPILGRAMAILTTLPLTPVAKARAARTLLLFKKQARRLRHYSYAYVGEYQFSPSSGGSPLLLLPRRSRTARNGRRRGNKSSRARAVLASLFCCAGGLDVAALDGLPAPLQDEDGAYGGLEEAYMYGGEEQECEIGEDDEGGEEEEVDRRAERFIERFYREMRMQETQRLLLL